MSRTFNPKYHDSPFTVSPIMNERKFGVYVKILSVNWLIGLHDPDCNR